VIRDIPLFWFETELVYHEHKFWLVEFCVFWNGVRQIVEMVEIKENFDDYVTEE